MNKFVILVACLMATSAQAEEVLTASLFFSPEQIQKIEMQSAKNTKPIVTTNEDIHLGAVFYYAPDDWVLWLQGERWTPATERQDIHVDEVTPDHVVLSVSPGAGQPQRDVVLKPYQTYQLSSGLVVEGGAVLPVSDSR